MTFYFCELPFDPFVSFFGFFGTLFCYNFIKYIQIIITYKGRVSKRLLFIAVVSLVSFFVACYCFFKIDIHAQILSLVLFILCLLYAIPLKKSGDNLRNYPGIKVYIVCFVWATVTVLIPIVNAHYPVNGDILLKWIQRFILVLVLIGIFEIVDFGGDSKKLKTIPQRIGVAKTKLLLSLLLIPFFVLEIFKIGNSTIDIYNNLFIGLLTIFFIWRADQKRSMYYTLFWVESIPIFWWVLVYTQGLMSK